MDQTRLKEVKRLLEWYAASWDERHKIFGLLDNEISVPDFTRILRVLQRNSLDAPALFMLLRSRWASNVLSELVEQAILRQIIEKWDENTLDDIVEYILQRAG